MSPKESEQSKQAYFFSGKLTGLAVYVDFPENLKSKVLRGVMVAAKNAPDVKEWIMEELKSPELTLTHGGKKFDIFYGVLADLFIKSIDNEYRGDVASLDSETRKYREKFYNMIRPLCSEDLYDAVDAILHYGHSETEETPKTP
jgi:hypothetical protein